VEVLIVGLGGVEGFVVGEGELSVSGIGLKAKALDSAVKLKLATCVTCWV
jgi:hypothetical protein